MMTHQRPAQGCEGSGLCSLEAYAVEKCTSFIGLLYHNSTIELVSYWQQYGQQSRLSFIRQRISHNQLQLRHQLHINLITKPR